MQKGLSPEVCKFLLPLLSASCAIMSNTTTLHHIDVIVLRANWHMSSDVSDFQD